MGTPLAKISHLNIQYYAMDRFTVGPWWNYRSVTSPFTRLFLGLGGSATLYIKGTAFALRPGRLVLAPPFLPVSYHCARRCDNIFTIFTCQMPEGTELFSLPLSRYSLKAFAQAESYARRLVTLNPRMKLHEVDPAHPQYNAYLWHAEQNRPRAAPLLETQGLLRLLLAPFLNLLDPGHASLQPHRLQEVLHYIDHHLEAPLSLYRLSEVCNLHPTYLSDLFARIMGLRPIAYINQKRIERAQLALITTNEPVKRIAYNIGFHDANYFSRLFKKQTGLSPGAYRQHHR